MAFSLREWCLWETSLSLKPEPPLSPGCSYSDCVGPEEQGTEQFRSRQLRPTRIQSQRCSVSRCGKWRWHSPSRPLHFIRHRAQQQHNLTNKANYPIFPYFLLGKIRIIVTTSTYTHMRTLTCWNTSTHPSWNPRYSWERSKPRSSVLDNQKNK